MGSGKRTPERELPTAYPPPLLRRYAPPKRTSSGGTLPQATLSQTPFPTKAKAKAKPPPNRVGSF